MSAADSVATREVAQRVTTALGLDASAVLGVTFTFDGPGLAEVTIRRLLTRAEAVDLGLLAAEP